MATLTETMEALAATLEAVPGAHAYSYPVDKPELPALIVEWPDNIEVEAFFGDAGGTITLPVRAVVSHVDDRTSATALQELVAAALTELETYPTLDGEVSSVQAQTVADFGKLVVNEAIVGLSAVITVEVFAG